MVLHCCCGVCQRLVLVFGHCCKSAPNLEFTLSALKVNGISLLCGIIPNTKIPSEHDQRDR
jgi:hypothetical protein